MKVKEGALSAFLLLMEIRCGESDAMGLVSWTESDEERGRAEEVAACVSSVEEGFCWRREGKTGPR